MSDEIDLFTDVERRPVDDLIPYENNPKEHPDEQVVKIADAIEEFGFTVPMVVDGKDQIVAGHGRHAAVREHLDIDEVPVIERDDLTPEQVRAFRIADNRVAESAWDIDKLGLEIEGLAFDDVSPESLGMDEDELETFNVTLDDTDIDAEQEWEEAGLVDYENEDDLADYSVKVNFPDEEAIEEFDNLVEETVTPKTDAIWFPPQESRQDSDMGWENETDE